MNDRAAKLLYLMRTLTYLDLNVSYRGMSSLRNDFANTYCYRDMTRTEYE